MTRRAKEPQKGKLGLAGGFVEADETLEEAVKWEVEEELGGLRIYDLSYLCSFPNTYPFKGIDYFTMDSVFVCKSDSKEIKPEQDEVELEDRLSFLEECPTALPGKHLGG